MTREEQLKSCNLCKNRSFNPTVGTICGLTNAAATFDGVCPSFIADELEIENNERKVKVQKADTNKDINKGRYALFIIGGLYILTGFLEAYVLEGHAIIYGVIDWFVAAIFIGLGVWSYKQASLALIIGLIVYFAVILLLAFLDPSTIIKGIIWKAVIIYSLIYSIKTARSEEAKIKKTSVDLLDEF
jgi:hypothetical protein